PGPGRRRPADRRGRAGLPAPAGQPPRVRRRPHVTPDLLRRLRTAPGEAALAAATRVVGHDPLAAASALRGGGVDADLAAAALSQAVLRSRAQSKFGTDAESMFFTRASLEQATRALVADRRAARLAAAGVRHLADLCCGIGADTIAAARAGLTVTAV